MATVILTRRKSLTGAVIIRRRQCLRWCLVLPLLYLLGLVICASSLSLLLFFFPNPTPGSVYRSHQIFFNVKDDIFSDNSSHLQLSTIWRYRKLKEKKPCQITVAALHKDQSEFNGYLIIEANGGLNQQRSSICNAVAVAGLLNATLLIPLLAYHNVWQDPSVFGDIYDEQYFISTLDGFVKVERDLPATLMQQYNHSISNIPIVQVPAWSSASYYIEEVFPVLRSQGVVRIAPFANRLSMRLPPRIQYLRCLANYKALRFAPPISMMGKKLVRRLMEKSPQSDGKYVSVHLRFEEDMVAFSCCIYDGGEKEHFEMDSVREKGWRGKFRHRRNTIKPGLNRVNGKCPMTPLEVGMMLRGMGFDNNTLIYLASGKLYQEERHLSPLLQMFPLLYNKKSLATPEELTYFKGYSSRLAAVDYVVCLLSEVFVTTQGGNLPHFLMGHRRYFYGGHAKTIKPDKQKLTFLFHNTSIRDPQWLLLQRIPNGFYFKGSQLIHSGLVFLVLEAGQFSPVGSVLVNFMLMSPNMFGSWKEIKDNVKMILVESDREGITMPRISKSRRKSSVYKYPFPECRCLAEAQNLSVTRTNMDEMLDLHLKSVI